ncbi:toll/interleukin-1 receptor-like protein [Jatropha curcas]|uniref:toll/interleukin-1 receptor-like protein n=1 Tax=Jatropha curcas TaxID=180498 RepID=UPI001896350D|nr:toll/interleukin-1 receptor-like protein [Jatropha curcas]
MHDNDDPSTYPAAPRFNCDVFLSFNGKDTSRSLIKHLCDSLTEHGVRFVQEDIGISEEDEIDLSLIEAIEDSAASIVIISPSYANSCCRLEALSRICELRRRVLPVFHQVNPSHVRRQEGPFKDDFRNYLERFGEDKVSKWRRAMKKVGGLSGFVIDNSRWRQYLEEWHFAIV